MQVSSIKKEGLLTAKDKKKRLQFAREVMRLLPETFWGDGIQFYFDGVSFVYKTNPFNDASATKTILPITKVLFYVNNIMEH